jgi:hypothetical protein
VNNILVCYPLLESVHELISKNTSTRNDKLRKWIADKVYEFACSDIGDDPFRFLLKNNECISQLRGLEKAIVYIARRQEWEKAHPGYEYDEKEVFQEDDRLAALMYQSIRRSDTKGSRAQLLRNESMRAISCNDGEEDILNCSM